MLLILTGFNYTVLVYLCHVYVLQPCIHELYLFVSYASALISLVAVVVPYLSP
jgi:hypothetical protein